MQSRCQIDDVYSCLTNLRREVVYFEYFSTTGSTIPDAHHRPHLPDTARAPPLALGPAVWPATSITTSGRPGKHL